MTSPALCDVTKSCLMPRVGSVDLRLALVSYALVWNSLPFVVDINLPHEGVVDSYNPTMAVSDLATQRILAQLSLNIRPYSRNFRLCDHRRWSVCLFTTLPRSNGIFQDMQDMIQGTIDKILGVPTPSGSRSICLSF